MSDVDIERLTTALRSVSDPASGRDIVTAGLVDAVILQGKVARATLRVERGRADAMESVRAAAEAALRRVAGIMSASVVLTSHRPEPPKPAQRPHSADGRPKLLQEVRAIVAVASGKGGVGKSTTAVNIAVSLARQGLRVGLLDADIYGPSLPLMLGLDRRPELHGDRMVPLEAWGLKAMSIGFLVPADTAMIWRGPMVMGALEQMMGQVEWGPLDILIVDMPPGTGDAQLTMAQRVALHGAVIVSTPQDLALADARRAVKMFEQTRVPVLGLIENMSFFRCPHCGEATHVFGHGGARAEARRLGIPFLGEVPLLLQVRETSDAGTPVAAAAPDSAAATAYAEAARRVWERVDATGNAGVKIVVE